MNRSLLLIGGSLLTWGIGEGMFLLFVPLYLQELGSYSDTHAATISGWMFGVLGVLLRLPRRLLLGLLLFILGLLLVELVHPTPRNVPQRGAVTGLRATPPPVASRLAR